MSTSSGEGTIFALSSGAPPAAIAIVRISGAQAGAALRQLAGRLPAPRQACLMKLRDQTGGLLDHALVLWFPGPRSATGEDLAELHLHGGRAVVAAVLEALAKIPGCRPAEPGAFTRRALLNGRIDLAEAEGLADLLGAETEHQRRHALQLAEGGLSRLVSQWRSELLGLSASVEAAIEFGEDEEDVPALGAEQQERIGRLSRAIQDALQQPPAERLHEGVRVLLAGPVNAGKSTLLNALAGREAAIATEHPGTTRDLIEVPLRMGGLPIILMDSAGLRDTADPVERIGIERSHDAIARADMIFWLGPRHEAPFGERVLVIGARGDLGQLTDLDQYDVVTSARSGKGIDQLRGLILQKAGDLLPGEGDLALHARHRSILAEVLDHLTDATHPDPLLVAEQLRLARSTLDRLTGTAGVEDMLDGLFGRFCIGK